VIIGPDHYRYRDVLNEYGMTLVEEVYQVIRETPAGYWVQPYHGYRFASKEEFDNAYANRKWNREARFVLKESGRRHCYPTRLEAMQSLGHRKAAQLKHAETSLARARIALEAANKIVQSGSGYPLCKYGGGHDIKIGMPPEFAGLCWY
jgi:hypothetical protein